MTQNATGRNLQIIHSRKPEGKELSNDQQTTFRFFFQRQPGRLPILYFKDLSKIRIKSTEMILETDWVQVYTFHNNKIIQFQQYYDTAAEVAGHQATLAS